jgi:lipoprotein signal peptidase
VTDFISLKSSQGLSIVFNYADLAIFVGIGLLLIHAVYYSLSFAQSAP